MFFCGYFFCRFLFIFIFLLAFASCLAIFSCCGWFDLVRSVLRPDLIPSAPCCSVLFDMFLICPWLSCVVLSSHEVTQEQAVRIDIFTNLT